MSDVSLNKLNGLDVVEFKKGYWNPNEISAAKCLGFSYNIETNVITCTIIKTAKRPLFEFIKAFFKNFNESTAEKEIRNIFFSSLKIIYDTNEKELEAKLAFTLPYYEKLYPHQKEAIHWAYHKQYNFLALDPRLGKTLSSASLSLLWNSGITLIVCPAIAKYNAWFRGLKKFGFNELYFTILDSAKKYSIKAFQERYIIINFDILEKFLPELTSRTINHIIIDEAQKIKNISSRRYKAMKKVVKAHPNAKITFLSGTPVKNRVDDLYSYLNLTQHALGLKKEDFLREYTTRDKYRVTGGQNLNDLHFKLSNFIFRKRREECLNLPKNNFISYKFELGDYKEEYDKLIEELSELKENGAINGNVHSLNRVTANAKVKGVIELANDILEQNKKVVIFGGYTEPLNKLETHFGKRAVKIDGSVKPFERDGLIERFTNDPKCDVFIGNSQAAGEAINLAAASDIIVLSLPWTPGELRQLLDRCIEIGKTIDTTVHLTFAEGSIDEYIYEILTDKQEDINAVIDKGGDIVYKENMTEILIRKLLKRDSNDLHVHLPVGTTQEAKTVEESNLFVREIDKTATENKGETPTTYDLPDFN